MEASVYHRAGRLDGHAAGALTATRRAPRSSPSPRFSRSAPLRPGSLRRHITPRNSEPGLPRVRPRIRAPCGQAAFPKGRASGSASAEGPAWTVRAPCQPTKCPPKTPVGPPSPPAPSPARHVPCRLMLGVMKRTALARDFGPGPRPRTGNGPGAAPAPRVPPPERQAPRPQAPAPAPPDAPAPALGVPRGAPPPHDPHSPVGLQGRGA